MADEWYYAKGGEKTGPVTHAELLALARSGGLARSDVVWSEGMPQWAEAGSVDGLFTATVGPPPLHERGGTSPRPWSDDERSAPNPRRWLGLGGAGCACGFALLFVLISITTRSREPFLVALWFLGVAGLVGGVWGWNFLGLPLHGRWVPADDKRGWVEFLSGGTFRREDGTVGTYVLLKNHKFIDFIVSGRTVDSWKVLAWGTGTLEVQDTGGEVRGFTKGKTLAERESAKQLAFFGTSRADLLVGKWEPAGGDGPAVQFNPDGAMIQFDGVAGRYTLVGEPPQEVVVIDLGDGNGTKWEVLSLSRHELILKTAAGPRHYRRGASVADEEFARTVAKLVPWFGRGRADKAGPAPSPASAVAPPPANHPNSARIAEIERVAKKTQTALRLAMLDGNYAAAQVFQTQLMQLQQEWQSL
jgi:hypothetical protein